VAAVVGHGGRRNCGTTTRSSGGTAATAMQSTAVADAVVAHGGRRNCGTTPCKSGMRPCNSGGTTPSGMQLPAMPAAGAVSGVPGVAAAGTVAGVPAVPAVVVVPGVPVSGAVAAVVGHGGRRNCGTTTRSSGGTAATAMQSTAVAAPVVAHG